MKNIPRFILTVSKKNVVKFRKFFKIEIKILKKLFDFYFDLKIISYTGKFEIECKL